jgi:DNA-directed RNA polymerase specialized sigma24 family protein
MQVEKLVELIRVEKKCAAEEALHVVELLDLADSGTQMAPDALKKAAFELWEIQFGQSSRNFGLSRTAFQDLVTRLQAGDQTLFEHVFVNHFEACLNFLIYQKNIPQPIAYDASMDTLIVFRQMLADGKIEYGNLRFLFTRIAVFAAQKISNKNNRIDPLETIQGMKIPEPEYVDAESVQLLGRAWKQLDTACQQILSSFYYDNQSWKDIAAVLQITEGNARKKGQRCREALSGYVKKLI